MLKFPAVGLVVEAMGRLAAQLEMYSPYINTYGSSSAALSAYVEEEAVAAFIQARSADHFGMMGRAGVRGMGLACCLEWVRPEK